MSTTNHSGPAFPCVVAPDRLEQGAHQTGHSLFQQYGMTLRDYFAAKALSSLVTINYYSEAGDSDDRFAVMRATAREAYEFADAMLEAREKK
jgi:TfoX/Sxy family transcriptional regulator of competence genes